MQISPQKTDWFDWFYWFFRPLIFYTRQSLLLHSIFIMQKSSHETGSFHQLFLYASIVMQRSPHETGQVIYTRQSLLLHSIFITCKDPRTRQIHSTTYFLHMSIVMQRSSHETDSTNQFCTGVSHYYCTVFLLCKDPHTRQIHSTTYFLHVSIVMQRSSHETDLNSYIHASIVIIAQYFYYAKILARDRFIPQLLLLHSIFVMQRSSHIIC